MEYEQIKSDSQKGILTLTLNRPEKLNSYTEQMACELIDAIDKANKDDEIRCIVITGEGRNFCAGADLSVFQDIAETKAKVEEKWKNHPGELILRIFKSLKPVIGAVQGAAIGVGSTMLLPMDIRLAETNTNFGFTFTQIGLVPEACSTWFLPKIVGLSKASEWMITGHKIKAQEAKESGLVTEVYSLDDLLPAAYEIAHQIIEKTSAVSVALTRQMIWKMLTLNDLEEVKDIEHSLFLSRLVSDDALEAFRAFFEKRTPQFKDKVSKDMPHLDRCFLSHWWQH